MATAAALAAPAGWRAVASYDEMRKGMEVRVIDDEDRLRTLMNAKAPGASQAVSYGSGHAGRTGAIGELSAVNRGAMVGHTYFPFTALLIKGTAAVVPSQPSLPAAVTPLPAAAESEATPASAPVPPPTVIATPLPAAVESAAASRDEEAQREKAKKDEKILDALERLDREEEAQREKEEKEEKEAFFSTEAPAVPERLTPTRQCVLLMAMLVGAGLPAAPWICSANAAGELFFAPPPPPPLPPPEPPTYPASEPSPPSPTSPPPVHPLPGLPVSPPPLPLSTTHRQLIALVFLAITLVFSAIYFTYMICLQIAETDDGTGDGGLCHTPRGCLLTLICSLVVCIMCIAANQSAVLVLLFLAVIGITNNVLRAVRGALKRALLKRVEAIEGNLKKLLRAGVIRLVSVEWLLARPGSWIAERRQSLPDEAFLTPKAAVKALELRAIAVLSYRWLSKVHPDPNGFHMAALREALTTLNKVESDAPSRTPSQRASRTPSRRASRTPSRRASHTPSRRASSEDIGGGGTSEPEDQVLEVTIDRGREPIGITIELHRGVPTICNLARDGVAARDGNLNVGDAIRGVNGQSYATLEEVTEALGRANAGASTVQLTIARAPVTVLLETTMRMQLARQNIPWSDFTLRLYSNRVLKYEKADSPDVNGEIIVESSTDIEITDAPGDDYYLEVETEEKKHVLRSSDKELLMTWARQLVRLASDEEEDDEEEDEGPRLTGLFVDFMSCMQKDEADQRTEMEAIMFKKALDSMGGLYASPRTLVLQHKQLPDDVASTGVPTYDESGWCNFEQAAARLCHRHGRVKVLEVGLLHGDALLKKLDAAPDRYEVPSLDDMDELFLNEQKTKFVGNADREMVASLYRDFAEKVVDLEWEALPFTVKMGEKKVLTQKAWKTECLCLTLCVNSFLAMIGFLISWMIFPRPPPLAYFIILSQFY